MRQKGKLKTWNSDKAFGFISPNGNASKDVFVHKSALQNKNRTPKVGDIITFNLSTDDRGRQCATNATFSGEKLKLKQPSNRNNFSIYLAAMFIVFLVYGYITRQFTNSLLVYYLLINLVTFLIYWLDKAKAQRGSWRISESSLHMFSLIGGWAGAAFAQQVLRHKSKKRAFRVSYWFTVVVHTSAFIWLLANKPELLHQMF